MTIFKFFARHRARKYDAEYTRGYNFAAGALLRGVAPRDLELVFTKMIGSESFDEGVIAAITDWVALHP